MVKLQGMKIKDGLELTMACEKDNNFKTSRTVCVGENARLRITAPRLLGVTEISAVVEYDNLSEDPEYFEVVERLYGENELNGRVLCERLEFKWRDIRDGEDIYEAEWKAVSTGLYYLRVTFSCALGTEYREYQLTVYKKRTNIPEWFTDGIMYQIFPDRFAKSLSRDIKPKPYAQMNGDWYGSISKYAERPGDAVDNNEFFGGDLYGVAEKLDYLRSLGVNIIYLNPIFEAHSNHRYDTGDYMKVDGMLGGDDALDELIRQCRLRGMRVILDGVFNHTGNDSIYFNAEGNYPSLGAAQGKASEYYDWYSFKSFPDDYVCWWGVKILPTLNKSSRSLRNFISGENGVIRYWLKKGISGWRLDVADELPDGFIAEIRAAAKKEKEDCVILGEVWEDASNKVAYGKRRKYFQGNGLDCVMNYPLKDAIIAYTVSGDAEKIGRVLQTQLENYPEEVTLAQMNFLGTHDTERIINVLSGVDVSEMTNKELAGRELSGYEKALAVSRLKFASTLLYLLPGVPCIYYGDEVGLEGWRDPFNRRTFPWGCGNSELLEHYRSLGRLRMRYRELRADTEILKAEDGVFVFRRGSLCIIANKSETPYRIRRGEEFSELISGDQAEYLPDGYWEYYVQYGCIALVRCGNFPINDECNRS